MTNASHLCLLGTIRHDQTKELCWYLSIMWALREKEAGVTVGWQNSFTLILKDKSLMSKLQHLFKPFSFFFCFWVLSSEVQRKVTTTIHHQLSWGGKVDFFISYLKMNEDIKMHKFPALNLNKNANETLWVLMMQRASSLLFVRKHEEMFHADSKNLFWCIRIYDTTYSLDVLNIKTPSH